MCRCEVLLLCDKPRVCSIVLGRSISIGRGDGRRHRYSDSLSFGKGLETFLRRPASRVSRGMKTVWELMTQPWDSAWGSEQKSQEVGAGIARGSTGALIAYVRNCHFARSLDIASQSS